MTKSGYQPTEIDRLIVRGTSNLTEEELLTLQEHYLAKDGKLPEWWGMKIEPKDSALSKQPKVSTCVTVTQVDPTKNPLFQQMSTESLDSFIQAQVQHCTAIVDKLNQTVREQLYPALLEMESRFEKKPGARNDIATLKVKGWHDYLRTRGITPEAFRKWKSRNAIKEVQQYLLPSPPRPKRKKEFAPADETESALVAKAGLRVVNTLLNPLIPENERVEKAVKFSEELAEAVQGGEYHNLITSPESVHTLDEPNKSGSFEEGEPIPLAKLADRLMGIADELRCAWGLDDFADQIDTIAERVEDREELDKRMEHLHKTWPKFPDGSPRPRSLDDAMKHFRRDRRFQEDMRLIVKAGGTTYRGKPIKGGDDPYIVRYTRKELMAEFKNDLDNQLGVGGIDAIGAGTSG